MRHHVLTILGLSAALALGAAPQSPLPRRDAFFSLHFDLHPNETDKALGTDVSEEMIARLLERVRPDDVQYDCKGHAGWAGDPTKVGWGAPGIRNDSLAVWRKVTRHLLNRTNLPMPDRYDFTDFIPAIGPLGVTLSPEGTALDWTWADGKLRFTLPRLEIHAVAVVD
ncbi:MAG: hypothetical protein FJY82_03025 [Candidatus Aminicenantes bacterium]|nr:hypothetical protein [Candidatus Aminicenantes bacterium]